MKNLTGKIIIAEPFLGDPNFERAVVLICEHNDAGSFGLVLNQPIKQKLADVIAEIYADFPLGIGGPVEQNTLHFVHTSGSLIDEAINISDNLYWSGDFETAKSLLNTGILKPDSIKFFLGYSGWGPGQLEAELAENAWMVSEISSEKIFENKSGTFWREVLRDMGGNFKVMANYPIDPRLN
ncbi:MAG: YqgE/AlgH family protein [Bacteroidetes bacterium]|jgi:putative transcriptional regulator|nr:YqgE/AlgH family protein [Bacteroidota bacterium]